MTTMVLNFKILPMVNGKLVNNRKKLKAKIEATLDIYNASATSKIINFMHHQTNCTH